MFLLIINRSNKVLNNAVNLSLNGWTKTKSTFVSGLVCSKPKNRTTADFMMKILQRMKNLSKNKFIKFFKTSLKIFNPNKPPFSKSEFPHWLQAVQALQKLSTNASLDYNMTDIRKYSTSFDDIISKF